MKNVILTLLAITIAFPAIAQDFSIEEKLEMMYNAKDSLETLIEQWEEVNKQAAEVLEDHCFTKHHFLISWVAKTTQDTSMHSDFRVEISIEDSVLSGKITVLENNFEMDLDVLREVWDKHMLSSNVQNIKEFLEKIYKESIFEHSQEMIQSYCYNYFELLDELTEMKREKTIQEFEEIIDGPELDSFLASNIDSLSGRYIGEFHSENFTLTTARPMGPEQYLYVVLQDQCYNTVAEYLSMWMCGPKIMESGCGQDFYLIIYSIINYGNEADEYIKTKISKYGELPDHYLGDDPYIKWKLMKKNQ